MRFYRNGEGSGSGVRVLLYSCIPAIPEHFSYYLLSGKLEKWHAFPNILGYSKRENMIIELTRCDFSFSMSVFLERISKG